MSRRSALLSSLVVFMLALAGCSDDPGTPDGGGGGGGESDGSFQCLVDGDCEGDEVCDDGQCVAFEGCRRDADCPDGHCDLLTGQCVAGGTDGGTPDAGPGDGGELVCNPGAALCNAEATAIERCLADGSGWESEPCPREAPACLGAACVLCAPSAAICQDDVARTCNQTGTGWEDEDCGAAGNACVGGLCQTCVADEKRCSDDATILQICNSTGTGWINEYCFEGACDPAALACEVADCVPGSPDTCRGDEVVSCNLQGEFVVETDCAATTRTCRAGVCVDPCQVAQDNNSYLGCEYWPVVLTNDLDSVFHTDFAVVVANPHETLTAAIEVFQAGSATPVATQNVAPGALEVIRLPWNALSASSTAKGAIAYKMVSNLPVTAYQFNPLSAKIGQVSSYTNDASLLLPAHTFGDATESPASTYVAMTVPHQEVSSLPMPGLVAVVASSPGATVVSITSRGAASAGGGLPELSPGTVATVTLQQHEVLQIVSRAYGSAQSSFTGGFRSVKRYAAADLTGSIITADKPIAAWGAAVCHYVPYNKEACDHLEQQLFPFENWGSRYVGSKSLYPNNNTGDLWRVVAAVDGTEVRFTPTLPEATNPTTLNRGEKIEFSATVDFTVSSQDVDHPIMVAQFFKGIEVAGAAGTVGDPTMILAIPTEQYRDRYTFITPPGIAQDFVNVIRPAGITVTLDGTAPQPTGGWLPVYGSGYEVGRIPVGDGTHHLAAAAPVGLVVYGFDWSVSYGYPGGLDLKPIVSIDPGQ